MIAAARETLALWAQTDGTLGIDFAELAADIAAEAEQARFLTEQIEDLDERIANLYTEADPDGFIASAPGVGPVISAILAGRLGDPHRFTILGRDPRLLRAGAQGQPVWDQRPELGLTKAGDPLLREALFIAADQARRVDPQLGANTPG